MSRGLTSEGVGMFMGQLPRMKFGCIMRKLKNVVRSKRVNSCDIEMLDG
jgi:hypothetical protein